MMKIIITGSLGNISKPLTKALVQKGHAVTVISSKMEREKDIEALGATAAIGSLDDIDFLTESFTGADVVYCMTPLNLKNSDLKGWITEISRNYAHAIQKTGIKRVIALSGWVAGIFPSYKEIESIFTELSGVFVTQIRPGSFYSNFFDSIAMIKEMGMLASIYGGEDRIVFSAPADIADAIVEEIMSPDFNNKVRYVASDEMTCNEAAKIIGTAIGKPDLKWAVISEVEMQKALETAGLSPKLASDIVEMQVPIHKGLMSKEFSLYQSEVINGKIKLKDFAKEFAGIFNNK